MRSTLAIGLWKPANPPELRSENRISCFNEITPESAGARRSTHSSMNPHVTPALSALTGKQTTDGDRERSFELSSLWCQAYQPQRVGEAVYYIGQGTSQFGRVTKIDRRRKKSEITLGPGDYHWVDNSTLRPDTPDWQPGVYEARVNPTGKRTGRRRIADLSCCSQRTIERRRAEARSQATLS